MAESEKKVLHSNRCHVYCVLPAGASGIIETIMARLNGETLQIEGSVDSWDGNEDLANAERVAQETGAEFRKCVDREDSTFAEVMTLWNAWNRARAKLQKLQAEYDLHADRSEASRHDAEVEAQSELA